MKIVLSVAIKIKKEKIIFFWIILEFNVIKFFICVG